MDKIKFLFAIACLFFMSNAVIAQQNNDRATRHAEQTAAQATQSIDQQINNMSFRFETALEDRDNESAKAIHAELTTLMSRRMKVEKLDAKTSKQAKNLLMKWRESGINDNWDAIKSIPSEFAKLMK